MPFFGSTTVYAILRVHNLQRKMPVSKRGATKRAVAMATKKPRAATSNSSTKSTEHETQCDVCCSSIVDGADDALQCEGAYQKWFHRYCAGVPKYHHTILSNSSTPFLCWVCSQRLHHAVVSQLQAKISALEETLTTINSEVTELRSLV